MSTRIWKANGVGQYLPSDEIPKFDPQSPDIPQDQYAVKINLDDPDPSKFPIGAQASAAIYTNGRTGAWAALRKISIRAHVVELALSDAVLMRGGGVGNGATRIADPEPVARMRSLSRDAASIAALFVATALSGCAPVGPISAPRRDRVAAVQGDRRLEDRDAASKASRRANGGAYSTIRSSSRLESVVADLQSDRQGGRGAYREALALINEARAGLFPTINGDRLGRPQLSPERRLLRDHDADGGRSGSGRSTSGVWCGARSRRRRRARKRARPISPTRCSQRSRRLRSPM